MVGIGFESRSFQCQNYQDSFIHYFLPFFLPSCFPSFLLSFPFSFLPSLLPSSIPLFLIYDASLKLKINKKSPVFLQRFSFVIGEILYCRNHQLSCRFHEKWIPFPNSCYNDSLFCIDHPEFPIFSPDSFYFMEAKFFFS